MLTITNAERLTTAQNTKQSATQRNNLDDFNQAFGRIRELEAIRLILRTYQIVG